MIWPNNKLFKRILRMIIIFIIIILAATTYFVFTYPLTYKDLISMYAKQYDVDPYLVAAIINVESKYDKNAISSKEARGLMQISPTTGHWAAEALSIEDFKLDSLFEPETNIMIGTWYLSILSKEFNNNIQLILAAYNGGSGNVTKWLENSEYCEDGVFLKKIPFEETEQYIEKVLKNIKIYEFIYKGEFEELTTEREAKFLLILHNIRRVIKGLVIHK